MLSGRLPATKLSVTLTLAAIFLHCMTLITKVDCSSSTDVFMIDTVNQQSYPIETNELATDEQTEQVEDKILQLLGLPDTPRPSYKHLKNDSAPQFMMRLYQEIQKQEGLEEIMPTAAPSQEDIGPEYRNLSYNINEHEKIENVDIVISFVNQPGKSTTFGIENEHDRRYYFELEDVPDSELRDAELRVYKAKPHHHHHKYFFTAFRIDESSDNLDTFGLTVLDTLTVNGSYEGWLVFNVSVALDTWLHSNATNLGIFLEARLLSGDTLLPHQAGIVNRHGEHHKQCFMVAFFKSLVPLSKKIAEIQTPLVVKRKKRSTSTVDDYWNAPIDNKYTRKMCQRKHLYVQFKRLRFDSWIIAPDGYPAFYCEGECSFPLSSHMNATNHAIVQTLVSLIQPKRFPKACCAPKKLSAITVLYFDKTQNVVMKRVN